MKRNRKTATVLSTMILLLALGASWIAFTFLPYSAERLSITSSCLGLGLILAFASYAAMTRLPNKRWVRASVACLFVLVALAPAASAVVPRITYSRFGLTVYGATPIPALDITVDQHGLLWFRPKTHEITRAELDELVAPGVDVVVVGIGWHSIARLTDEAKRLGESVDLRVLPTPDAFALYNALKAAGRNVVLLAHSTC